MARSVAWRQMESVTLSDSLNSGPLALLPQGVLADTAKRHGDRLPGLRSRLGLWPATHRRSDAGVSRRWLLDPAGTCRAGPDDCGRERAASEASDAPDDLGSAAVCVASGTGSALSFVRHPLKCVGAGAAAHQSVAGGTGDARCGAASAHAGGNVSVTRLAQASDEA